MLTNSLIFQGSANAPISLLEPTLADVHAAIEHDPLLPKSTREALCCSLRRVANFLGRDLSQLPARLGALRHGIARLHHAQLGISRKTLQNHIANLKAAIRHVAGQKRLSGRGIALSPAWRSLYDLLTDRRLRFGLSGFLKYCSATGIDPSVRVRDKCRRPSSPTSPRCSSPSSRTISTSKSPVVGTRLRKLSLTGQRLP